LNVGKWKIGEMVMYNEYIPIDQYLELESENESLKDELFYLENDYKELVDFIKSIGIEITERVEEE
jgi:hypothetical protein